VFERFTDRGRRAVVLAQEEARRLDHDSIGPEHVLLGLLRLEGDLAAELLEARGVTYDETRARVAPSRPPGQRWPSGHIPFTSQAKKALEMSLREALKLGDSFIGTEHLLLGLMRAGTGLAAEILEAHGAELEDVRRIVLGIDRAIRRGDPEPATETETVTIPAEQFSALLDHVNRLRDLLRQHGIDPGEELPDFGQD
jgi:ATP-dependent Clp protease ATP-binding subunit ClpC